MIVLFSGGTASRSITAALSQRDQDVIRVVPAWDSGGSSKLIREALNLLSIGDVRQALMTLAFGEGRATDVVRICNSRISSNLPREEALTEFLFYAQGRHPSMHRMEAGLRSALLNYLKTFLAAVGPDFDFRDGSIGNFVLTGAILAHNGDVNTAIFVFRKLCGISGNVWPSALDNDLVLSATLRDGRVIAPQHAVTRLAEEDAAIGIKDLHIAKAGGSSATANPAVLEAIERADLIAFGPGSLFTSILPHLAIAGISAAIEKANCAKVLISNILQCRETQGFTLKSVLANFEQVWASNGGATRYPFDYVITNQVLFPFVKTVGAFPYLVNDVDSGDGLQFIAGDYEDVWNRGQHDGSAVADTLIKLHLSR